MSAPSPAQPVRETTYDVEFSIPTWSREPTTRDTATFVDDYRALMSPWGDE